MSRKYKFYNPEGVYFISFATVFWLDIFVREKYFVVVAESLNYCRCNKGMELFAFCILPSHLHLIFRDRNGDPGKLVRELKTYTSKKLIGLIEENPQESRKEWLLWMMERAGQTNSNIKYRQFWQQHNQPIELWSNEVIEQKLNYVHDNPVEAGFVTQPHHWKYSSAVNFTGGSGVIDIDAL